MPSQLPLLPPQLAGYRLRRLLGRGAFGEVWEAEAPGGVPIAIKRIFGTVSAQAIERERQSLDLICSGKLRHPFLLQVFGWWLQDGKLHILRHTFCSRLAARGAPAKAIQRLAGHSSIMTTEKYMHLSPNAGSGAIKLLDGGPIGAQAGKEKGPVPTEPSEATT